MRNVSDKVAEKIKTLIVRSKRFLKNHAVCEIMRKNIVELDTPQISVWCLCIACWIPKAENTHSE